MVTGAFLGPASLNHVDGRRLRSVFPRGRRGHFGARPERGNEWGLVRQAEESVARQPKTSKYQNLH